MLPLCKKGGGKCAIGAGYVIISVIILCITLSIDALFAGFSYGFAGTKIPLGSKLVICAFSVIYSAVALLLGSFAAGFFSPLAGKIIGAVILAGIGVWMIIKPKIKSKKQKNTEDESEKEKTIFKVILKSFGITIEILKNNVSEADIDRSGIIDIKEALLLGFALSVDSLGAGIGFALSGLTAFYIPFCVGLFQLAFLSCGLGFGAFCEKKRHARSKYADSVTQIIPGVLLILLAGIRLL